MMSKTLTILLLMISWIVEAQTTETKYYRSRPFDEEVPQEKAKYSRTITTESGTTTTTTTNLKKGQVEHREAWRNGEPVGTWVILTGSGPEELDYNFEMLYQKKDCSNPEALQGVTDLFKSDPAVAYTAPVIDYKDPELYRFIGHSLRYPGKARRSGIQGVVELVFTITKEGTIQDITVTKGVDIVLDKEAVRVFRKLKLSSPALLDGKPHEVCVKMPVRFKLA